MPGSKVLSPGQSLEVDVQKCNMFLNREILWNPLKSWVYLEMFQAVAYRCRVGIQTYEDRWSVAACFNSSVDLCCVGVDAWMSKRSHTCMLHARILFGILQHIALSIKYDTVWLPAITHPDHGPHIDSCWHKRWTRKRSNTSTVEPSDIQHLRFLPSWDVRTCEVCFPRIPRNASKSKWHLVHHWLTLDLCLSNWQLVTQER